MNIVFIHLGNNELPQYLIDNLAQTSRLSSRSKIHLLASGKNIAMMQKKPPHLQPWLEAIFLHNIDHIPRSYVHTEYTRRSTLDRSFRNGFWYFATLRFFVLHDFIRHQGFDSILHLENDVVFYTDPTRLLSAFEKFSSLAVPLDRVRAIPGIVWCADESVLGGLVESMLNLYMVDDMRTIGLFCENNLHLTKPLPTIPVGYAAKRRLDTSRYCQGANLFGGIFDAAAIGQYLGGVDPRNTYGETRFFKNESSDLDLDHFDFAWDVRDGVRVPVLQDGQSRTDIHAIHVHSKKIAEFSPFAHTVPNDQSRIITGERIQALASCSVSRADITKFHGRENIKTPHVFEVPSGGSTPVNLSTLECVTKAKVIYVYTHLLDDFKKLVMPLIEHRFILITGNSDHDVTLEHLTILNNRRLVRWYAQNVCVSHPKLLPLPIGIENSQWWGNGPHLIYQMSRDIQKTKTLYVNFSTKTNPDRERILSHFLDFDGVMHAFNVTREIYLEHILQHKFVATPRGNGLDTHRFWESIYLGSIPIISRSDWCPSYGSLPVLVLDDYRDIRLTNLSAKYIELTTTNTETIAHLMPSIARSEERH